MKAYLRGAPHPEGVHYLSSRNLVIHGWSMLEIAPAESEAHYREVRELLVELIKWDTAQVGQLGLDAKEALDFYYAAGEEALPGRIEKI